MDFKDQSAFDAYNKKHKMRKSTKVNVGGKDTTAGNAEKEAGEWMDPEPDTGVDDVPYSDDEEGAGGDFGPPEKWGADDVEGGPKPGSSASPDDVMNATLGGEKVGDIMDDEDHPDYDAAMEYVTSFDPDDEKVVSGPGPKEGVRESVRKSRKATVKEVKKWFKTLEENRYKKTYASDARRVSWIVNNSLSEDYEAMPVSMKKKWPKAAYKRERFLAKEFVKHLKGETKLRESIRKIIRGLMND